MAFIRTNNLAQGSVILAEGRTLTLEGIDVPVLAIAGEGELFFAPSASAHHVRDLLPSASHVRLETAPGGHLGVLTGSKARTTTWQYPIEFLRSVDRNESAAPEDLGEDA